MSENQTPDQPADLAGQPAQAVPAPAAPSSSPSFEQQDPITLDKPAGAELPDFGSFEQPAPYQQADVQTPAYQAPPAYQPQQQGNQQGYQQPGSPQGYQQGYQQGGEQKSKVVAGILGILLGAFGIHNFYLGKTKIALIQLLVSVISFGILAPFMAVWGLIEGILILIGHESYRTDAQGVPLKD
ncbi:TM2 domain-containing protein [Arthrobacter cryoconiti]|uniref:TM2 domain-containing protein n=1 Tax=Arthrobacter cryoconiti TaxID=748907 RepID=A0ABV8R4X8_9MICC|nr:TM2 domain-containing protein [Arthrobacter cryoconiti]MCC9066800.1 TM2 domain-containing protein [Arthrobacter cryoconiti]